MDICVNMAEHHPHPCAEGKEDCYIHHILIHTVTNYIDLEQGCPRYDPWAKTGPGNPITWPTWLPVGLVLDLHTSSSSQS